MNNSNNNSTNNQNLEYIILKNNFYKALIQELFVLSIKVIEDYQKIMEKMKQPNLLDPNFKSLSNHIFGLYYSDITSKKNL